MMNPTILALDASSTAIGWCLYDGAVRDHGEVQLRGDDIADRCRQAHAALGLILANHPDVDCVALESPVMFRAKGLIPQCRVSGALMACAALKTLHVVEVTPTEAKKALTGYGSASKVLMQIDAERYGVAGEHASDALGVAIAAARMVSVVDEAAA
jgi:Holliday junction resolvasome RuvABC endonuclease subunit